MFWLFVLAITMPIGFGNCEESVDLTEITWAHAVNSWKELEDTLKTDVRMIESDVILGEHVKTVGPKNVQAVPKNASAAPELIPVMGHPPAEKSDLSLEQYVEKIIAFNKENSNQTKGIKLDFKTIEAVEASVPILEKHWSDLKIPVWINSDIIAGPVDSKVKPVDAKKFFELVKKLQSATLSIGWTTEWGATFDKGSYTDEQVDNMIKAIEESKISETKHSITFPVRAGTAAQSKESLNRLYENVKSSNSPTFTIWSSKDDKVDVKLLEKFILSFGVDKVYVDVPEELKKQLNLKKNPGSSANSLVQFGLLNVLTFVVVVFLRNGLN